MPVKFNQMVNTVNRAAQVNEEVEGCIETLLSDPPMDQDETRRSEAVRYALLETWKCILVHVPVGADRNEVFRMLKQMRRMCNDSIVAGGGY